MGITLVALLVVIFTVSSAELFRASGLWWVWGALVGFFFGLVGMLVSIVVYVVRNRARL